MTRTRYLPVVLDSKSYAWQCKVTPLAARYDCEHSVGDPTLLKNSDSGTAVTELRAGWMTDVVTPNFKKRQASGEIINNPMAKAYDIMEQPIISFSFNSVGYNKMCSPLAMHLYTKYCGSGTIPFDHFDPSPFMDPPNVDISSLKDQAIAKAWANIGSSDMLALATLKESKDSLMGLIYILNKVYKIRKAVKTADLRRAKKELSFNELQEVYMNARYNLRPLYYDAKALSKIISTDLTDKQMRQTFRGKIVDNQTDSDIVESKTWQYNPDFYGLAIVNRNVHVETTVRAGVLTDVDPPNYFDLFGITSIPETLWDLVPFSFIIDWFWNVGDTILAFTPVVGHKTLASWVTIKQKVTQTATLGQSSYYSNDSDTFYREMLDQTMDTGVTAFCSKETFERIPEPSRPVLPRFNVKLDPLKLLDLGIILKKLGRFKSIKVSRG